LSVAAWALLGAVAAVATAAVVALRWQLDVARTTKLVAVLAAIVGLTVGLTVEATSPSAVVAAPAVWLITLALSLGLVAFRFYRDPERMAPNSEGVIVSPSDGTVLYVKESRQGVIPAATKGGREYRVDELTKTTLRHLDAVVVGIGLTMLDDHVNRAPISGRVTVQRRVRGSFGSLRRPEMVFENERATIVIERGSFEIAVVLIASRLVRRILTYVDVGDSVALGQRIGMIRFGSQVDLVVPSTGGLRLQVAPGERVVAGETIVATLDPISPEAHTVSDPVESTAEGRPVVLDDSRDTASREFQDG
jgi:phosphatidylserine decarboxylase